jgi:hypothetical protein
VGACGDVTSCLPETFWYCMYCLDVVCDVASCRDRHGPTSSARVPSLRICSTGAWSFVPPRRFARQELGHSARLTDLLDGDLIVCLDSQTYSTDRSERGCRYPIPRYRQLYSVISQNIQ